MSEKNGLKNLSDLVLKKEQKIAFVCSPRLGDTLISFVVLYNLYRSDFDVDIYGDFAYELKEWFPWAKIFSPKELFLFPEDTQKKKKYDLILQMYESDFTLKIQDDYEYLYILSSSPLFLLKMSLVDIQVKICEQILGLKNVIRENGMQPLESLTHRKHKNRIAIHPTSSHPMKSWSAKKFIALIDILSKSGFQPCFILSPQEREKWRDLINSLYLPEFKTLSETAAFIYESAWFIGNDSGIGHMASNLGIPTLSLVLRSSVARQWRPSWAYGKVVLPPIWLITRPLKEKFWKYTISVNRVLNEFDSLVKNYSNKK